jgi:hypothetical protein
MSIALVKKANVLVRPFHEEKAQRRRGRVRALRPAKGIGVGKCTCPCGTDAGDRELKLWRPAICILMQRASMTRWTKLAKGKAMLEVTDRALEEVNSIIADTRRLIIDDPFSQTNT